MKKTLISVSLLLIIALAGCMAKKTAPDEPVSSRKLKSESSAKDMPWNPDGIIDKGEYAKTVEAAGVSVHWSTDEKFLYGALSAKTKGWIAVGFDPDSGMAGANYIFGYVKDGKTVVADMFGSGGYSHPLDTDLGGTDDIKATGGSENGGVTVIEFQIPLDSGDAKDKPLVSGKSYRIILAHGNGDSFSSPHTSRGSAKLKLD